MAPGINAQSGAAGSSQAKKGKTLEDRGAMGECTSLTLTGWAPRLSLAIDLLGEPG